MIDFSAALADLDGAPLKHVTEVDQGPVALSLGWACRQALADDLPDDRTEVGEKKLARIGLALRLPKEGAAELSAGDITLIRERLLKRFPALIAYRAIELLDPASLPK